MKKYVAIIDTRTVLLLGCCALITFVCKKYSFSYNLNVTLFSIAVVFPLVFTIREAFKRRDAALKFLSQFKSAMIAAHYAFEQAPRITQNDKKWASRILCQVSDDFIRSLETDSRSISSAQKDVDELIVFIQRHRDDLSNSATLKIIRFLQDVHESMENTMSLKLHGTPVSLRAYCLVFVFLFPLVFIPTVIHNLAEAPTWTLYSLSLLHGFILISLYNVQADMENPFDQIGLDDIQLDEYRFEEALDHHRHDNSPEAITPENRREAPIDHA